MRRQIHTDNMWTKILQMLPRRAGFHKRIKEEPTLLGRGSRKMSGMKCFQQCKPRATQASWVTISIAFGRNTRIWSGEEEAALKDKREVVPRHSATTKMQGEKEGG